MSAFYLNNPENILDYTIDYTNQENCCKGAKHVIREIVGGSWSDLNDDDMKVRVIETFF